jgi:thymidylate kinase
LVFVALEGFSGTGKTTLAIGLEKMGWLRLAESAHAVPKLVPVADRADTSADYSLLGATMVNSAVISRLRNERRIVSEGYLLSDLAYARIRHDLGKSRAYPAMLEMCRTVLKEEALRPDLYILLEARPDTIEARQKEKDDRERNITEFFRTRYYTAIDEIHRELGENNVERLYTDSDPTQTLEAVVGVLRRKGVAEG